MDRSKIKVPQDVFEMAEERLTSKSFDPKGTEFRCQFEISGKNGGKWFIVADDKERKVNKGSIKNPISTLIMKEADFTALVAGKLNVPMAFIMGQIKVGGDRNHIIELARTLLA